jgi:DsbC/DsbD-like thiol-disulfide interchange protein
MKKIVLTLASFFIAVLVFAQPKNPVSFTYEAVKNTNGTYDVIVKATVDKGWHIYSQNTDKGGPIPTSVTFKANPLAKASGKVLEKGKLEKVFDKAFGVNVLYFSNSVQFIQNFKVKAGVKTTIKGTIEYMVCDDEMCLPAKKQNFEVKI